MAKRAAKHILPIIQINAEEAANTNVSLGDVNVIELEVCYSLGGTNCFTHKSSPRGYYLHAAPVKHVDIGSCIMVTSALGSGIKVCLLEVSRQSDKQFEVACAIAADRAKALLEWCRSEYGIICEEPAEFFPDVPKRTLSNSFSKPKVRKKDEE